MSTPANESAAKTAAPTPRFRLTDAMQLAGLSLVGYGCAFAYEMGYLSWFDIPIWMVRLDLSIVLVVVATLAAIILPVLSVARYLSVRYLNLLIAWFLPFFAVLVAVVIALHTPWTLSLITAVSALLIVLLGFAGVAGLYYLIIKPIAARGDQRPVVERWIAAAKNSYSNSGIAAGSLGDRIVARGIEWFGTGLFKFGLYLVAAMVVLHSAGALYASSQKTFTLLQRNTPCLALRRYGEGVLCVDVDTLHHRLSHQFRIIPLADTGAVYRMVKIDHLRTADDTSADATSPHAPSQPPSAGPGAVDTTRRAPVVAPQHRQPHH